MAWKANLWHVDILLWILWLWLDREKSNKKFTIYWTIPLNHPNEQDNFLMMTLLSSQSLKPLYNPCKRCDNESSRIHNYNRVHFSQSLMNVVNLVEMTMTRESWRRLLVNVEGEQMMSSYKRTTISSAHLICFYLLVRWIQWQQYLQ